MVGGLEFGFRRRNAGQRLAGNQITHQIAHEIGTRQSGWLEFRGNIRQGKFAVMAGNVAFEPRQRATGGQAFCITFICC